MPMPVTLAHTTLPVFRLMLRNLSAWLEQGSAHAQALGFDPALLMQTRLAPDMLPLAMQVRIACDTAKGGIARLAGIEVPPRSSTLDATPAEAQVRIAQTLSYLDSIDLTLLDGADTREVSFPIDLAGTLRTLKGLDQVNTWVLPNFYFHVCTAYALLRHNGVALGKVDYLTGQHPA